MDDLVQFLRDRLEQEEAACRAARKDGGGSWNLLAFERGDGAIYDDMGNPVLTYDVDPSTGVANRHDENPLGAQQAAFIVRHDPDRVLTDIRAKRQLVDKYAEVADNDVNDVEYAHGYANALGEAVRLLALPYADHPNYRQEWRP
ncbi:DUF6221 family protein [Streptomyces bottropensis]|uniref:DUF6221 family protein n=1 Tax=Streptomyces bottropensis TaxID=42235 RepID=UPI0036A1E981